MSIVDSLRDSFEDRHLVLQALLGLLSASDRAASAVESAALAHDEPPLGVASPHPLVLLTLGMVSVGEALRAELNGVTSETTGDRVPASASVESPDFPELLR